MRDVDYFSVRIETGDGEVERILDELASAQEKIRDCYCKLREIGVLVIKKPPEATDG